MGGGRWFQGLPAIANKRGDGGGAACLSTHAILAAISLAVAMIHSPRVHPMPAHVALGSAAFKGQVGHGFERGHCSVVVHTTARRGYCRERLTAQGQEQDNSNVKSVFAMPHLG